MMSGLQKNMHIPCLLSLTPGHPQAAGICEGGQAQVDRVIFLVFCPGPCFMGIPQSRHCPEELDKEPI